MNTRTATRPTFTALAAALLVAGACLAGMPRSAAAAVNLDIQIGPPPPRVIVAPPPRTGYVWAPGYWRWDGHRHVWMDGRWLRERRGHAWVAERWVQHDGRWRFERGHWDRAPGPGHHG